MCLLLLLDQAVQWQLHRHGGVDMAGRSMRKRCTHMVFRDLQQLLADRVCAQLSITLKRSADQQGLGLYIQKCTNLLQSISREIVDPWMACLSSLMQLQCAYRAAVCCIHKQEKDALAVTPCPQDM